MLILDTALKRRAAEGRPIRVGLVGAGYAARPLVARLCGAVPGIELVAIANRRADRAAEAYRLAAVEPVRVGTVEALEAAVAEGRKGYTDDPALLCAADGIELIIEATGSYDYGALVVLDAIAHAKHVLLMNAELDGSLGPLLKARADAAGVLYSNIDGDQPAVIMNLYRFVEGLGCDTKLLGNIKGLQDPHRTPTTQQGFAAQWGQKPHMVTSFADGSKVSFEMAVVANATGFGVAHRGMYQPEVAPGTPIEEIADSFPVDELLAGSGVVDYCVGASPAPGVFALATNDDPYQQGYLDLFKLGWGPLYCFYTPYHLCHFEVHNSIVRMVDFDDVPVAPMGAPVVDVVAIAKTDIAAGETLDGLGGYLTYGEADNHASARAEGLLPLALGEGARVIRNVAKDQPLTFDDVELSGRPVDALFDDQERHFATLAAPAR